MHVPNWLRPPRQLMVVFLVVALASTGLLAWLTFQLLAQDRAAEQQRQRERLEQAADTASADMGRQLADLERHLDASAPAPAMGAPPSGAIVVSWNAGGLNVLPANGLLYRPVAPATESLNHSALDQAERLEARRRRSRCSGSSLRLAYGARPQPARAGGRLAARRTRAPQVECA